jgi:hypothetical protein
MLEAYTTRGFAREAVAMQHASAREKGLREAMADLEKAKSLAPAGWPTLELVNQGLARIRQNLGDY